MKCTKCGSKTHIIESRQRKRIANAKDQKTKDAKMQALASFVITNASTPIANIASPLTRLNI